MKLIEFIEMVASLIVVLAVAYFLLCLGTFLGEQLELFIWLMTH